MFCYVCYIWGCSLAVYPYLKIEEMKPKKKSTNLMVSGKFKVLTANLCYFPYFLNMIECLNILADALYFSF